MATTIHTFLAPINNIMDCLIALFEAVAYKRCKVLQSIVSGAPNKNIVQNHLNN